MGSAWKSLFFGIDPQDEPGLSTFAHKIRQPCANWAFHLTWTKAGVAAAWDRSRSTVAVDLRGVGHVRA